MIRAFGRQGIAARLREHIRLGQLLAGWIDDDPDFERLAPTPLSVVCFRAAPKNIRQSLASAGPQEAIELEAYLDRLNEWVVDAVNASGQAFLSPTRLRGRYTIRLAIGNIRTDEAHVKRIWQLLRKELKEAGDRGSGIGDR